jgi:hypothetical protein
MHRSWSNQSRRNWSRRNRSKAAENHYYYILFENASSKNIRWRHWCRCRRWQLYNNNNNNNENQLNARIMHNHNKTTYHRFADTIENQIVGAGDLAFCTPRIELVRRSIAAFVVPSRQRPLSAVVVWHQPTAAIGARPHVVSRQFAGCVESRRRQRTTTSFQQAYNRTR